MDAWPEIEPVGSFVAKWAQGRNLAVDWVIRDAISYLLALSNGDFHRVEEPRIIAGLDAPAGDRAPAIVALVEFRLPAFAWHSEMESWGEFEARVLRRVKLDLRRKYNQITGSATEHGFSTQIKPSEFEHFEWLVRYQVGHHEAGPQTAHAIARAVYREWQTVKAAIDEKADLIELPLRPRSRGGRPRLTPS